MATNKFVQILDGAGNSLFPNINDKPFNSRQFTTVTYTENNVTKSKVTLREAKFFNENLALVANQANSLASAIHTSNLGGVATVSALTQEALNYISSMCVSQSAGTPVAQAIVPTAKAVWNHTFYRNVHAVQVVNKAHTGATEGHLWFYDGRIWVKEGDGSTDLGVPQSDALFYCSSDGKFYKYTGATSLLNALVWATSASSASWATSATSASYATNATSVNTHTHTVANITNFPTVVNTLQPYTGQNVSFYTTNNGTTTASKGNLYISFGTMASATSTTSATHATSATSADWATSASMATSAGAVTWANVSNRPTTFVSKIIAGEGITISPEGGTGNVTISCTGGGGGVTSTIAWGSVTGKPDLVNKIIAGTGISVNRNTGSVTISCTVSGGGGGGSFDYRTVPLTSYAGSSNCDANTQAGRCGTLCYQTLAIMWNDFINNNQHFTNTSAWNNAYTVPSAQAVIALIYNITHNNSQANTTYDYGSPY